MTARAWLDRVRRDAWLAVTILGAIAVTTVEAGLLQRRYGLFTGGFLSRDHLEGVSQIVGFLLLSTVIDAAVIGVVAAGVLEILRRVGLRHSPPLVALALPVGGLLASDFVQYRLLDYLGEVFDLTLMFDLAGRSLAEMLAVSAEYLVAPMALSATALCLLTAAAWTVERYAARRGARAMATRAFWPRAVALLGTAIVLGSAARLASEPFDYGLRLKPSGQVLGSLVRRVTDVDRDGFGLLRRPADPAPWDAGIYPYAAEIPGNGIDENGVGGDLPLAASAVGEPTLRVPAFASSPPVVLILLESFRADLVGSTHRGAPVTPVLDRLAQAGTAVSLAYSHNGYTAQSRFHLFSGTLVASPARTTLVDDFKANGYQVAYFSGQDESFGGPRLGVGFDRAHVSYDARDDRANRYSRFSTAGSLAVGHQLVRERVRGFLEARHDARPLFLYVNLHDTHFPYHHDQVEALIDGTVVPRGEIGPDRADELWAMYVNTASNVDRAIGLVIEDVRDALGADPAVIVTSDHGESLYDDGLLGHGYALNDAQTRVPLIAANLSLDLPEPFGQSDLRAAIWQALGVSPSDDPSVTASPSRLADPVFQYLGYLRRPRQIAQVNAAGRVIYDFRTGLVQVRARRWVAPHELSNGARREFLALVHRWEAMVLAAENAEASGDPEP